MSVTDLLEQEKELRAEAVRALQALSDIHTAIQREVEQEDRQHRRDPLYARNRTSAARFIHRHRTTQRQVQSLVGAVQGVQTPPYVPAAEVIAEAQKELEAKSAWDERRKTAKQKARERRKARISRPRHTNEDVVEVGKIHA
jgi:hypothetical protein